MTNSHESVPEAVTAATAMPETGSRRELKNTQMELRFTLNMLAETKHKVEQLRAKIASLQTGQGGHEANGNQTDPAP